MKYANTVMRNGLSFIFLLSWFNVFGQNDNRDTIFISKYITDSQYHIVYILHNTESKYYRLLADSSFIFDRSDSGAYSESIQSLFKDTRPKLKKFVIGRHLLRHWCTLYPLKEQYYLYVPCDGGNIDRFMITDSTLVNFFMDGPYAYLIDSFAQEDKNTFVFGVRSAERTITRFTLHVIDWKRQIAVLDNGLEDPTFRYTLMVGADKARSLPIIVNDCRTEKEMELEFDRPDFEKILKGEERVR